MTTISLRVGGRTLTARVDPAGEVLIDDSAFAVTAAAPGLYVVDNGTGRWLVAVADDGDARWVSVDGQVAVVEVEAAPGRGRRKSAGARAGMMSPMPATVVQVLVAPGQAVREGETVLVLEAMKMELPIRAPRDGVVSAVACTQGDLVSPGVALVELA